MESVGVATNTNAAYELMKRTDTAKKEGYDYEIVGQRYPPVMSGEREGEVPFLHVVSYSQEVLPSLFPFLFQLSV